MIKVIIFDFDGVLVESVDIKTEAFRQLFKDHGKAVEDAVVRYHELNTGVPRREKFRYIYQSILEQKADEAVLNHMCSEFGGLVKKKVTAAPYVHGAASFLEDNVSRYTMFIASAAPQAELEEIISERGMGKWFSRIYGAPVSKKEAVQKILIYAGVKASEAVFVGDAMADYNAAAANGVQFIARVAGDRDVFGNIQCPRIKNLISLEKVILQI